MSITATIINSTLTSVFLSGSQNAITTMFFCNNSANTSTSVNVYAVPAGLPPGTGTIIINALPLPATETFVFDAEKIILENGDQIWATSLVSGVVTALVSYVQTS